jgi:hypothetical protein
MLSAGLISQRKSRISMVKLFPEAHLALFGESNRGQTATFNRGVNDRGNKSGEAVED